MKNDDNLNSALAIVLVPLIFIAGWFFTLNGDIDQNWQSFAVYFLSKGNSVIYALGLNIAFSIFAIWSIAVFLGFGKFGTKILQFRQEKNKDTLTHKICYGFAALLGSGIAYSLVIQLDLYENLKPFPKVLPEIQIQILIGYLRTNFSLLGAGIGLLTYKLLLNIHNFLNGGMPPLPKRKNILVIGSKLVDGKEEWISIGRPGLVTGILLIASTGGGKSIACLLPWAKQFMTNFDPFPSIIVIDPKNTFALAILELAKKIGLFKRVVHFTLDGNWKTNPIYRPDMLRESGLPYVTNMIRAATINFMGAEQGDQKFWGLKSGNLIKALLAYCAARFDGYFTLADFYRQMIQISDSDFATELEVYVEDEKYDWEEKRNLQIALEYFRYEFLSLDTKIKDSIAQTATSFLSQLRDARIERVFCPAKEEINFWGFDEIVDNGKIFVFGVDVPGLSGPISVLMKLMYQSSVMERLNKKERLKEKRISVGLFDEYQTFASVGGGQTEGDDDYAAKRREALGVTVVATQSHSSLMQALGNDVGKDVMLTNFRTHIVGATLDERTVKFYERIGGEVLEEVESESYTESGHKPVKQLIGKGLMTSQPTVSQSVNKNQQKRPRITGEIMSRLKTFEAIGLVFNGVDSEFYDKICLKPAFFPSMRVSHEKVIKAARAAAMACFTILTLKANAFPSVCSVVNCPAFELCMEHTKSACTCGFPPHPCTFHSYYVISSFIEVTSRPKQSFFSDLPFASSQLSSLSEAWFSSGSVEMDNRFYHARVIPVPFANTAYTGMPCGTNSFDRPCFEAMSEHVSTQWKTGSGDVNDPQFKLWALNPKACLVAGAASAATTGRINKGTPAGGGACSYKMPASTTFPPVTSEICGGWGTLLPRTGFVESNGAVSGALLAAQRIRSIANEVYHSTAIYPDEKWQMIFPQSSTCFREGHSVGKLETFNGVNEIGRMTQLNQDSWLFVVWRRVSCCSESTSIPQAEFAKAAMKAMCKGLK